MSESNKNTTNNQANDYPSTAETLGQTKADRPFDGDWVAGRRKRNWAILGLLVVVCAMFYFITIIRMDEGAKRREMERAVEAAALINQETAKAVGEQHDD